MHIASNREPNAGMSRMSVPGPTPNDATAIDGSTKHLFGAALTLAFEVNEECHDGTSSTTYSLLRASM